MKEGRPSDDELTTASPQGEKSTASQDQARQSSTDDGAWDWDTERDQLGSELSTGVLAGVDVKIGQPVFDSHYQGVLGTRDGPALGSDKGRIVKARIRETKEWG